MRTTRRLLETVPWIPDPLATTRKVPFPSYFIFHSLDSAVGPGCVRTASAGPACSGAPGTASYSNEERSHSHARSPDKSIANLVAWRSAPKVCLARAAIRMSRESRGGRIGGVLCAADRRRACWEVLPAGFPASGGRFPWSPLLGESPCGPISLPHVLNPVPMLLLLVVLGPRLGQGSARWQSPTLEPRC